MLKETMLIMKYGLGNPLSRLILRYLASSRYKNGRARIDMALASFAGVERPTSLGCKLDSMILDLIIKIGAYITKSDIEGFKSYAADPAVRRGLALILKGIAEYGVTVPQKLPAPFLIVWNFTNACNLRCKHCYQRADKPLPDELTLKEKLDVVRQLDEAGVAAIAFSGGEPTIHPDFLRVVREASSRGIYVAVATNGTTITPKFAEKMREAGVRYVEISLDSPNPIKHNEFRGCMMCWERTVMGIKNSVRAGLSTGIAMTVTKQNYREIPAMAELAEKLGVNRLIFFNFIPVGRGRDIIDVDLTPEEREESLKMIFHEAVTRRIEIASTAPQFSRVSLIESKGRMMAPTHFALGYDPGLLALAEFIGGCGAGRIYAAIQPNGDVSPCVFLPIKVGSVRETSFSEIWRKSKVFNDLRDRSKLAYPCNICPYRNVCGGCRARAYAYTGDYMGPDPGCIIAKDIYYELVKRVVTSQAPTQVHAT